MKKILIIRFSSIGDIVLTSPVVRCVQQQVENVELHYVTKKSFQSILAHNPYIHKLHLLDENGLWFLIKKLRAEQFDFVIDLHNNLRTRIIKTALGVKSASFHKLNFKKFLFTQFKKNTLPNIHIVDRYLATAKSLGVKNDGKGLDYFIPKQDQVDVNILGVGAKYIGVVLGAKFATKRLPYHKLLALCQQIDMPIVLLGGKEDVEVGKQLVENLQRKDVFNACGKFNLNQSASIVEQAQQIITHDTGLMHIASAFQQNIISIWGNTVPAFGMYAYVPKEKNKIIEVENLACRPCSKIGYAQCPKKHFACMENIAIDKIYSKTNL